MKFKQWLLPLLTFVISILGGGYAGQQMAAPAQYDAPETYSTAYGASDDYSGAQYVADYDVDVYWLVKVEAESSNALPAFKVNIPYFARHTVRIADKVTDDKVAAALNGKAPLQNSSFMMLYNYKLVRWIKRQAQGEQQQSEGNGQ